MRNLWHKNIFQNMPDKRTVQCINVCIAVFNDLCAAHLNVKCTSYQQRYKQ